MLANIRLHSFMFWMISLLFVAGGEAMEPMDAPASGSSSNPNNPAGASTPLDAGWDAFFDQAMTDFGVHGAVMVIVQDGQLRFARGYGYADAARQVPVDPQTTILRAGSIAKTLTATALLQLAEQGSLDLDADVNQYLTRYQVPSTFPEPVTARQLINMTAGFDTRFVGIRAASREQVLPLADYLAQRMPPRVLPPGRYRRYNDHELALAGLLVEDISGLSFEGYVQRSIFQPLEMDSSSVLLPDDQLDRAARGYPVGGGAQDAYPLNYYYLNMAPGAGFNTTAIDMAHYLLAHLDDGQYTRSGGSVVRILSEQTSRQMKQTAFAYHPSLPGQANSFDEMYANGRRYLRKQGGAPGMQNNLMLFPEDRLGFYLFYNSDGSGLSHRWAQTVLDKVALSAGPLPARQPSNVSAALEAHAVSTPEKLAGYYREVSDQTSKTTLVQVQALVNPDLWLRVQANADGSLQVGSQRHIQVEPGLYRSAGGGYLLFELDEAGQARYLFLSRTPYERVAWFELPSVQLGVLAFAVLALLAGIVLAVAALLRGKNGWLLPGLAAVLPLASLLGLAWLMLPVATGGDRWQFTFEPSFTLRLVLALPLLASLGSGALLAQSLLAWRAGESAPDPLLRGLLWAGTAALLFFLNTWNLLGWRF